MKRKKIAFFVSSFFDGIGVNTVRLAKSFHKEGYNVDLLITGTERKYIDIESTTINVIEFNCTGVYKTIPQLIQYMKRAQPEAIISGGEAPNLTLILTNLFLFKRIKTKIIVSIRTHLSTQYSHRKSNMKSMMLKYLGKILYRFADQIVAVSKGVAADVSQLFGVDRESVKVIYNPIVEKNGLINSDNEEELLHPWINEGNSNIILGVGRLVPQKNFQLLINAFAIVRESINAKLIIVGEGSERELLEGEIQDLGLKGYIDLVGYQSNPYTYMKNADVFVLSSEWEGFGNVIVEAMICGTKVVSTDCPSGPSEILDSGKYGFLVERNNSRKLADAILTSLKSELDSEDIITRANYFSVENTMEEYKMIIENE